MPNDNFSLINFVDSQLKPQEREKVEGMLDNQKIDYKVLATQLEQIILENMLKFPNTAQSSDLKIQIAVLLQPLADKLKKANLDIG